MRWWVRLLVMLVVAPLLWRAGVAYLASVQGASWADLAAESWRVLAGAYLTFTLPALVLGALLAGMDLLLHALGLDLLTVAVSPLVAGALAAAAMRLLADPRLPMEGATALAVTYGRGWGLTSREPKQRRPARRAGAAADTPG